MADKSLFVGNEVLDIAINLFNRRTHFHLVDIHVAVLELLLSLSDISNIKINRSILSLFSNLLQPLYSSYRIELLPFFPGHVSDKYHFGSAIFQQILSLCFQPLFQFLSGKELNQHGTDISNRYGVEYFSAFSWFVIHPHNKM